MPTPSSATMFASLGTLPEKLDLTDIFSLFENWVQSSVITAFSTNKLGAAHVIYGADVMFMCAALAAAAYAVIVSVDRVNYWITTSTLDDGTVITTWRQFFHIYGHDTSTAA